MARTTKNNLFNTGPEQLTAAGEGAPSPVAGMDMEEYKLNITRALNDPDDPNIAPAFAQWINERLYAADKNEKEKREQSFRELVLRLAIQQQYNDLGKLADRYNQMADEYGDMAANARTKMLEAAEKLEKLGEFIDGANEVLDEADEGNFDREKALKLLRERGIEVDEKESDAMLLLRLREEEKKARGERAYWSQRHDRYQRDAERFDRTSVELRKKAEELLERRDHIRAQNLPPEEEARRLKEITDQYEEEVRRKAAELARDRQNFDEQAKIDAEKEAEYAGASQESELDAFLASTSVSSDFNNAAQQTSKEPAGVTAEIERKFAENTITLPGMTA